MTSSARSEYDSLQLGADRLGKRRALFLYDGACGVCKFSVALVADRDASDHVRFCPLQTPLAEKLLAELRLQSDLSTAVLLEGDAVYTHSAAILRLFPHMGFPILGRILLAVFPKFLRDFGYSLFARNRGKIWTAFKGVTGLGDTLLYVHRDRIVGLPVNVGEPPESWGLRKPMEESADLKKES